MADRTEAFRQRLRELGYVEGKNILIEWRYGEEKPDRVSEFAAELVRLKVEIYRIRLRLRLPLFGICLIPA
jgi:putative ABC transport system substrate-binding protein